MLQQVLLAAALAVLSGSGEHAAGGEHAAAGGEHAGGLVPFSYSLHRQSSYAQPVRFFLLESGALEGRSLALEQRFREGGAGLGSAAWDGSFVLGELLQRVDFVHGVRAALDEFVAGLAAQPQVGTAAGERPWLRLAGPRLWLPSLRVERTARRLARARRRQAEQRLSRAGAVDDIVAAPAHTTPQPWRGLSTVELGTGLGLVSLVTCLLGATSVATDGDAVVLQHARLNFARNLNTTNSSAAGSSAAGSPTMDWMSCGDSDASAGKVATATLLWGDRERATAIRSEQTGGPAPDFVLAADVVYGHDRDGDRTATFDALLSSLLDLCGPDTIVLLAYKPRRPTEKLFFDRLWERFEGGALQHDLLHHDFHHSDMQVYTLRLRASSSVEAEKI